MRTCTITAAAAVFLFANAAFAQAPLFVPDDVFLVRYASNLTAGDSVINLTNTGQNPPPGGDNVAFDAPAPQLFGPGLGTASGNLCVNVYAFSPDEQLVSCCSCLITPNGLASLSVNSDLVSNTLTGVRPNSLVIKLVSTAAGPAFTGTNCTNSAALAGTAQFPLAGGTLAWGTTIHTSPTILAVPPPPLGLTETPFLPATLSPQELASIRGRCTAIVGNGSTFGICRSCRNGGLGAARL